MSALHAYSWRPDPDGASRLAQLRCEHPHNRGLTHNCVFTGSAHGPVNLWFISLGFVLGSPALPPPIVVGLVGGIACPWGGVLRGHMRCKTDGLHPTLEKL